ncbi:hypothetical protein AUEXF2481DRAFT_433573 [Aureobasidium subglaciale EXF-2481]|uniref:Zn(2)-C6 fungal-type domain-containing protein n=1 Tax=Aureobasidium subglaciale (strain EXF-2481) TaxID=1043005 RepID=A0A074Y388_AURSE|nr:uncharacterized protein AUEXF2481DRAFT_433573 [Aureobasidium subglaciale EXF-2481]KEQ92160.1 hypothetical protein AUEXF2481DRAFT_433573 [Aureobasidium subglaciale EXF-2481]
MSTSERPPVTPQTTPTDLNSSVAKRRAARERTRATRACDRCKAKKARCSGTQPCSVCHRSGLECCYEASYRRGRTPYILPAGHIPPTPGTRIASLTESEALNSTTTTSSLPDLNRTSVEEPDYVSDQQDIPGSYIGPASGVSFLTRAKKRLRDDVSAVTDVSAFAFGDTPLPEHDSSLLILPSKTEALTLLKTYFDVSCPTHRYLHHPTLRIWCDGLYEVQMTNHFEPGDREKKAIVLMVMAQATLTSGHLDKGCSARSAMFFGASEQQVAKERGETRLTSVMVRLLQCHYLASQSRINHAWTLLGTTARLAFAAGLHRKQKIHHGNANHIEVQCRRRTFWAVYSLDRYMSATLGRPKAIHDDDIDQVRIPTERVLADITDLMQWCRSYLIASMTTTFFKTDF